MNYLIHGGETKARIELLLKLTKIDSAAVCAALIDYFSVGLTLHAAASFNSTKASNLNRAIAALEEKAAIVEQIKDLDWAALKARPGIEADCNQCANRGKTNGLSQESFCESCAWQGKHWKKNHFIKVSETNGQ